MADDYEDNDQDAGGDDDSGATSDADLMGEVIGLLNDKFGLSIPEHLTSTDTFLRDLCMALHGHPGNDLGGADDADATDDTDEDSYEPEADPAAQPREEQPVAMMGHRRKKARRKLSQPRRPHSARVSAARGKEVAAEQLKNAGIRIA